MSSMVRKIKCPKCEETTNYYNLRKHLESCCGDGCFCPTCETVLDLTGDALDNHLINCSRKK